MKVRNVRLFSKSHGFSIHMLQLSLRCHKPRLVCTSSYDYENYDSKPKKGGPVKLSEVGKKPKNQPPTKPKPKPTLVQQSAHNQSVRRAEEMRHVPSIHKQGQRKAQNYTGWHDDNRVFRPSNADSEGGASSSELKKKRRKDPEKELERAKLSAAGSLSLRLHSRQELRKKMLDKGYAEDIAEQAMDRMQELELLDDVKYAEVYARSKWNQSKWAPSRILLELKRKGIDSGIADSALQAVFGNSSRGVKIEEYHDEDEDNEDGPDLSDTIKRLDQQLVETVKRRLERMIGTPQEAKKRRIIAWMQRRGHRWEVVSHVLREVELMR